MDVMTYIGVLGFLVRLGYTLTGLVWLWWRKEYRWDRMAIHLKTKQGATVFWGKTHAILYVLIALWLFPPLRGSASVLFVLFAVAVSSQYLLHFRRWLFPPLSPKVVALYVMTISFGVMFVFFRLLPILISLALFDIGLFPMTTLIVFALSFPTKTYHWWVKGRAVDRLRHHLPMTTIGITGSYGKTSVKDYLSTILSKQYRVLKTEASKNSPIGIAETVLRRLNDSDEVFVVEMGAYKRGEVKEMSKMVRPQIGILTAINPQHQDLFGTIESTMKAKYELFEGLTGDAIAIVNLDDERVNEMGTWAAEAGREIWGYTTKDRKRKAVNVAKIFQAVRVVCTQTGISFDCVVGREKYHVEAPVLGAHQAGNIVAAIAGAVASGMSVKLATGAARFIQAASNVMEPKPGINGALFIDDTFNNNPDAARAAISFLGTSPGKKILVFQPMIELGSFAKVSHEEVGAEAAKHCDAILLTNANFYDSFKRGVYSVSSSVPLLVANPEEAATYVKRHVRRGDTVLFKGKDAAHALDILLGHS